MSEAKEREGAVQPLSGSSLESLIEADQEQHSEGKSDRSPWLHLMKHVKMGAVILSLLFSDLL